MSKKIIATINKKTGEITIKTDGYAGAECLEATAGLERGLGMNPATCELTPEYWQQKQDEQQQVGGA
jgi:hypothetical protein